VDEFEPLPDITTAKIAELYRMPHHEVVAWVERGARAPDGTAHLPGRKVTGLPGQYVVRRQDLLAFLRRLHPEPAEGGVR
jgi:hypothetical protein